MTDTNGGRGYITEIKLLIEEGGHIDEEAYRRLMLRGMLNIYSELDHMRGHVHHDLSPIKHDHAPAQHDHPDLAKRDTLSSVTALGAGLAAVISWFK